jgi:hypothetical protein
VSRWKQVTFPGPFGSINVWVVPRQTLPSVSRRATNPHKPLVNLSVPRMRPLANRAGSCMLGAGSLPCIAPLTQVVRKTPLPPTRGSAHTYAYMSIAIKICADLGSFALPDSEWQTDGKERFERICMG